MFDSTFWVALAFVAFVALIAKKGYELITAALDKRAESIRAELEEAVRLREEAQALLAGYQRKQRDAAAEAEAIVDHAREEAARLAEEAEKDLTAAIERRTKLAENKIAQAEAQAVADVRSLTVDMAVDATRRIIAEKLDKKRAGPLVDDAIAGLEKKLH